MRLKSNLTAKKLQGGGISAHLKRKETKKLACSALTAPKALLVLTLLVQTLPPFLRPALARRSPPPNGQHKLINGQHKLVNGQHKLVVTVRDPRCPACLKTLKTYLLAINGVQQVSFKANTDLVSQTTPKPNLRKARTVAIELRLDASVSNLRIIERIKDHDLEILDSRPKKKRKSAGLTDAFS